VIVNSKCGRMRKLSWPIFRYYSSIFLERMKNITEDFIRTAGVRTVQLPNASETRYRCAIQLVKNKYYCKLLVVRGNLCATAEILHYSTGCRTVGGTRRGHTPHI
jgi:hypothetical protein